MAVFGLIATGLALKNFRDAKAEYNAAVADFNIEKTALMLGINEYNAHKYDDLEKYSERILDPETGLPYNENDVVTGLAFVPILNVYYESILGIKGFYYQRVLLGVTNTTDRTFTIRKLGGRMYCYGKIAGHIGDLRMTREYVIEPHKTYTLQVTWGDYYANAKERAEWKEQGLKNSQKFNNIFTGKGYDERLLNAVRSASKNHDKLVPGTIIQSSPSVGGVKSYCTDALTADFEIYYEDSANKTVRRALYKDIQGYICYVG